MSKIVLASGNAGKLKELSVPLSELDMDIIPQSDFNVSEAEETGLTFVENALIKARNACLHTSLPAIADDSGIEVDALNGEPGIYSARYSGRGTTNQQNLEALLNTLKDTPESRRTARYQCVIVYLRHATDPTPIICQASWEGKILLTPVGKGGFGYDSIFWVKESNCSAAELTLHQKYTVSHRGKAIRQLLGHLQSHKIELR
jgi:XTP/dITP diphosphohydrolase